MFEAHRYAKLFPALPDGELRALANDIKQNGLLEPVTLTADPTAAGGSSILDGVNRQKAAELVGAELRLEGFGGPDEEALQFVLSKNWHRRHMSISQRAVMAAEFRRVQRCTFPEAADLFGVGERTVKEAAVLIEGEPETAAKIKSGGSGTTVHRALMQAKARQRLLGEEAAREAAAVELPEHEFYVCTCRELIEHVEPGSVDVVICDPPYPKEYLHCWSELGEFAEHALKDGGLCVAMSGQAYLPEVHDRLREHLTYHWEVAYLTPGAVGSTIGRSASVCWKPILLYTNGKGNIRSFGDVSKSELRYEGRPLADDVSMSERSESDLLHKWGQSESGMLDLVQRFSNRRDLVADPFLGSGTTAVMALRNDRRFVGCDVEPKSIDVTRERLGLA